MATFLLDKYSQGDFQRGQFPKIRCWEPTSRASSEMIFPIWQKIDAKHSGLSNYSTNCSFLNLSNKVTAVTLLDKFKNEQLVE